MGEMTEELDDIVGQLFKRFEHIKQMQVRWDSRGAGRKIEGLLAIWEDAKALGLKVTEPGYEQVEDLRIRILSQLSVLDRKSFRQLRLELRDDIISATAEVWLAGIRLRSAPNRAFQALDDWLNSHDEKRRAHGPTEGSSSGG